MDNYFFDKITKWWDGKNIQGRPWNWSVDIATNSQIFTYINGATGFLFTNTGLDIVSVNGKVLYPGVPGTSLGDGFAIAAHKGDVFKGQIQIRFTNAAAMQLEIVQIFYMDVQQR